MKDKNENKMELTKEKRIFITKSYYEMKSYTQIQTESRILFPERLPPKPQVKKLLKSMRGMAHL